MRGMWLCQRVHHSPVCLADSAQHLDLEAGLIYWMLPSADDS